MGNAAKIFGPIIAASLLCSAGNGECVVLLPEKNSPCELLKDRLVPIAEVGDEGARNVLVPANKTYELLTASEKGSIREAYRALEPTDDPPYPKGGFKEFLDEAARSYQRFDDRPKGRVVMILDVDGRGGPPKVHVVDGPPSKFVVYLANWVALRMTFQGGFCADKRQDMEFPIVLQLY
jgi:hypothetical protein